jgi:hypothetical protein
MPHIAANCPAQPPFNPAPVQSRLLAADRKDVSLPAPGSPPGSGQPAGEPLITALVAERCPACGARLAPAAQWCSLCYADLRSAAEPADEPSSPSLTEALPVPRPASVATEPPAPGDAPAADAGTPPATRLSRPSWPCSGCGASVDVELDDCPACGSTFLGALRSSTNRIELPVVGDLGRFSDRARVVVGAVAGLLIAFVLVVITALLGR